MSTSQALREKKISKIRFFLETEGASVAKNTRGFNQNRYESVKTLSDYEALKDQARAIKEDAIARLPELVEQLRATVERNGGTFYLAKDAEDANRHIHQLCGDAKRLVKSKSMTSEEIEVNDYLQRRGLEVIETDLGEWVLQLAEEEPSHIVAPAIHKSREGIADLFNRLFEPEEPLKTAEELTMFARARLGELIQGADVGMTGANFIAADTGTLALVTSEGNARKTVVVPPVYIAVTGVEKVIPSVEDLQPFVELIGKSGTGQRITSYISLFTPPFVTPVVDFKNPDVPLRNGRATNGQGGDGRAGGASAPERQFHLVLVDNGRLAMREDPQLKETLYCIRCSACANVCANFQSVGGHVFGGKTYSGGIATGWEAGVHGLEVAATFNDLCTGCSRCVPACPVRIDIPWINNVVRDRINQGHEGSFDWLVEGLKPDLEPGGLDLQKRVFGNYSTLARIGSATAPLSKRINERPTIRRVMERVIGVDRRRTLPEFKRETLVKWFRKRGSRVQNPTREVVLYPDAYTNHVQVERGKAAVRALEALRVRVYVPEVASSGRSPLSQGMITTAGRHAREVYETLVAHIDQGREIIVIEPSDLAMFWRDYAKLLHEEAYASLRDHSHEVMAYLGRLLDDGADSLALRQGYGQALAYHSHCQQRTLGLEAPTLDLLRRLDYDVLTSDVECCGMAGSFGYKAEYYELSMAVGDRLREQFTTDEARGRTVVASGTSCQEQLEALLDQPARHPVELIAPPDAV